MTTTKKTTVHIATPLYDALVYLKSIHETKNGTDEHIEGAIIEYLSRYAAHYRQIANTIDIHIKEYIKTRRKNDEHAGK